LCCEVDMKGRGVHLLGTLVCVASLTIGPHTALADGGRPFSWTGFYAGAHAGYAFSSESSAPLSGDPNIVQRLIDGAPPFSAVFIPSSLEPDVAGFVGGLQVGYNWSVSGSLIAGIEVDISGSAAEGSDDKTFPVLAQSLTTSLQSELKWLSTVRGRIGFLPVAGLMVYGTAGLAFGEVEQNLTAGLGAGGGIIFSGVGGVIVCPPASPCLAGSSSTTSVGWTVGGGFELALASNVSLKGEYLFVDLGEASVTAAPTQPTPVQGVFLRAETETQLHVLRAGLNFKF
jgi:outer membrane immunogenic protein